MEIGTGIALLGPWALAVVVATYDDNVFTLCTWLGAIGLTLIAFGLSF